MIERFIILVLLIFLIGCNSNQTNNPITIKVEKKDFRNVVQFKGTVEAVKSHSITCPRIFNATIGEIVESGTIVKEGDTVVVMENPNLQNNYEQKLKNLQNVQAEYNKKVADLDMDMAMLRAQVATNEAQTEIANLDSLEMKYSSETNRKIKALELQKIDIIRGKLQAKLNALNTINKSELKKMGLRIKQREAALQRIEDQINDLIITTPQSGIAIRSQHYMGEREFVAGDNIYPGMAMLQIPEVSETRIKIESSESKYKRVEEGKKVEITFDSMVDNPGVGKISSRARMGKPIKRNSQIKVFDIIVSIDSIVEMPTPGLSANCTVILDEVKDTIVIPQIAVFEEDSLIYAYVKSGRSYKRCEVYLAESSNKDCIVALGLGYGDEIALQKPSGKLIGKTILLSNENKQQLEKRRDSINTANKTKPNNIEVPMGIMPNGI